MDIQNIWYSQMHCTCSIRPPLLKPPVKGVVFETGISVRLVDQESLARTFSQDSPGTMMIGLPDLEDTDRYPMDVRDVREDKKKVPPGFFLWKATRFLTDPLEMKKGGLSPASLSIWYPVCYSIGACSLFCIWFHSSSKYQKQPPADL